MRLFILVSATLAASSCEYCPEAQAGCVQNCVSSYEFEGRVPLAPERLAGFIDFIDNCDVSERDADGRVTRYACDEDMPEGIAAYDEAGHLIDLRTPGGEHFLMSYDEGGHLLTLSGRGDGFVEEHQLEWQGDVATSEHSRQEQPWSPGGDTRWQDGDLRVAEVTHTWNDAGQLLFEESRGGDDLFLWRTIEYSWDGEKLILVRTVMSEGGGVTGADSCPSEDGFFTCDTTFEYEGDRMTSYTTAGTRTPVGNCCARCWNEDG